MAAPRVVGADEARSKVETWPGATHDWDGEVMGSDDDVSEDRWWEQGDYGDHDDDFAAQFAPYRRQPSPDQAWFESERELSTRVPCPDCRRGVGVVCTYVGTDKQLSKFPAHIRRLNMARRAAR